MVTSVADLLCKNILSREIKLSAAYFFHRPGEHPLSAAVSTSGTLKVGGGGVLEGRREPLPTQSLDGDDSVKGRRVLLEKLPLSYLVLRIQRDTIQAR